jgi:hypothetical protein
MWEIFFSTGNIDAYLAYRACQDCPGNTSEPADESTEPMLLPANFSNHGLREARWQ